MEKDWTKYSICQLGLTSEIKQANFDPNITSGSTNGMSLGWGYLFVKAITGRKGIFGKPVWKQ